MADPKCNEACDAAYVAEIGGLAKVLSSCLLTATTDQERANCRAAFKKGLARAREVRTICKAECDA